MNLQHTNMQPLATQIYEIQTPGEAEAIVGLGVDHVGTVLVSREQWKQPQISATRKVVGELGALSSFIPLFSEPNAVYAVIDHYRPDIVHLCERLDGGKGRCSASCPDLVELQAGIRRRFPGVRIMRSIPIAPTGFTDRVPTLELARIFEPVSDLFLTDTLLVSKGLQPVAGFVGITGETCDWETAAQLARQSEIPVILAGGLSPENVYAGVMAVKPAGVDSCTRTNQIAADGKPVRFKKDMGRVMAFVAQARRAQKDLAKL
jgi:phosphoribosylanthranilate isomerase